MNLNFEDLTYGCDPETFAIDSKDEVLSPGLLEFYGLINRVTVDNRCGYERTKHPIFLSTDDYWWIMDGVAFELTLLRPYKDPAEMGTCISRAIEHLKGYIGGIPYEEKLVYCARPVVGIDPKKYLKHLAVEAVYQGFIFGCDPDRDVTEEEYVCQTLNVKKHKARYGGGHFHFGGNPDQVKFMQNNWNPMVKLLAIIVGNICVRDSVYPDLDIRRVGQYGRPGRFRLPPHGVEYRSPSNAWLNRLDTTLPNVFTGGAMAWEYLYHGRSDIIDRYFDNTCVAINSCNQALAAEILHELRL